MKPLEIILTLNDGQRFWAYVFKKDLNECWMWLGCVNGLGYGRFELNGKILLAHRVVYYLEYDVDPGKLCVCHHCDVPGCCNPKHLFLGTRGDNQQDAIRKGRKIHKLTSRDVQEIRYLLYLSVPQIDIAKKFNVTSTTISEIKTGRTWSSTLTLILKPKKI